MGLLNMSGQTWARKASYPTEVPSLTPKKCCSPQVRANLAAQEVFVQKVQLKEQPDPQIAIGNLPPPVCLALP
eukprot:scaffold23987_cov22-Tisochrysis_lutea.AAC.5